MLYLSGPSAGSTGASASAGRRWRPAHTTPRKAETRPRWPQRGLTVAASSSWSIDDRQIPHLHPPTAGTPRPFARHALRGVRRRSQSCAGPGHRGQAVDRVHSGTPRPAVVRLPDWLSRLLHGAARDCVASPARCLAFQSGLVTPPLVLGWQSHDAKPHKSAGHLVGAVGLEPTTVLPCKWHAGFLTR